MPGQCFVSIHTTIFSAVFHDHGFNKRKIQIKVKTLSEELGQNNMQSQTPFHLAAKRGNWPVIQQIIENTDDKILFLAARYGHLSVCQLILENIDEKNPKINGRWTDSTSLGC